MAKARLFSTVFVLVLLICIGAVAEILFVPAWINGLEQRFAEYSNEGGVLMLLLCTPLVLVQFTLLEICVLTVFIHRDRMFSPRVFKWVRLLVVTTGLLALSFLNIILWLAGKNTLPPAVLFVLATLSLTAAAVGLVTWSLLALLKKATTAAAELEGVI